MQNLHLILNVYIELTDGRNISQTQQVLKTCRVFRLMIFFNINSVPFGGFFVFHRPIIETHQYGTDKHPMGSDCCPVKE